MLPATCGLVAGEVQLDPIAANGQRQADRNVECADAVAIHEVFEFVSSVGDFGDRGPHSVRCPVDDFVESGQHVVETVHAHHFVKPPGAEIARSDLGVVVATALVGDAHVEEQDVHDVLLQHALSEQLDDRDPQTFLIDLRHAARHGAGHHAADIGVVGDVCR